MPEVNMAMVKSDQPFAGFSDMMTQQTRKAMEKYADFFEKGMKASPLFDADLNKKLKDYYQSSNRVTDNCPVATRDRHDFPGLVNQGVPGRAAVVDDVVEGFEDWVWQPVLAHELPDVFLTVELG